MKMFRSWFTLRRPRFDLCGFSSQWWQLTAEAIPRVPQRAQRKIELGTCFTIVRIFTFSG